MSVSCISSVVLERSMFNLSQSPLYHFHYAVLEINILISFSSETCVGQSPVCELSGPRRSPFHATPLCCWLQQSGGGGVLPTTWSRRSRQGQGVSIPGRLRTLMGIIGHYRGGMFLCANAPLILNNPYRFIVCCTVNEVMFLLCSPFHSFHDICSCGCV